MGMEFELKYRADSLSQQAVMDIFPGTWQTFCMETTYYDTPNDALSQRRFTLRRRLENGVCVCTVKTPAQGIGRGEWEVQTEDIMQAIPELCKLGCPQVLADLTRDGVIPVCGARFTRRALTVPYRSSLLELALDSGILFAGENQIPLCEVEAELKTGSVEDALAFGRLLEKVCSLVPESGSKFRRALALREE